MSEKLSLRQRILVAFRWCSRERKPNKSHSDVLKDLRDASVKLTSFFVSKKGWRFIRLLFLIAAGLDAIFAYFYFMPLHFLPHISSDQQWPILIMLFFGIVLFLGVIIWSLVLCNFLYRDAFVGNNAESEEVEKSFFQIKRCIIFWYTIMMLIDGTAFGAYQFFNWSFDFMWLLVGMLLTEMLLCFIPGYLIFQKFKNDHNLVPFSAWKITRTLWFSRVGFFVYALCLYVLSDQSLREEVWFFPFLQWVMFMNHFVFVSEKQELTVSSVLLSMMSISLFVIISFGILESADKGIMRTIGVGEKNVVVEFDKRVCNRAARMLQCNNASLHLDNCIFYHIEVPSAIGEERLVNIPINQFKTLTGCQLSKKSKQEISETGAVFLQIIVSQDEINTGRFLDESGKLVKNKKGHLVK